MIRTIDPGANSGMLSTPMTVCIAALAEDGKKAVLIADRLLSTGGILPYQTDGFASKIFKINDNVTAMWAGGFVDATNIIEKAKKDWGSKKLTVKETAEYLHKAHLDHLHEVLSTQHIKGRGLKDLAAFYGDKAINLPHDARVQIDNALASHTLTSNPAFIICGKDADNLYKIFIGANPRNLIFPALENYAAIGSGEWHAKFEIIHSSYVTSMMADKVKAILLAAKKKAEKSPDVGASEDILILE